MADPRPLTRNELAEFLPNQRAIRAFEKLFDLIPSDILTLLRAAEDASNVANSALSKAALAYAELERRDLRNKNLFFVSSIADLPKPIDGVHTLIDNATYYFTGEVDLLGGRIVAAVNTAMIGSSPENCRLKSTGLPNGTAILASQYSLTLRDISFESATIFNLDAAGTSGQALDWFGVNFINTGDVGRIANYSNFVASLMAFLGASGLIFDGVFDTIAWDATLFSSPSAGSNAIVTVPSTCTVNRRLRVVYSSVVALGTSTGFDVSTLASIPVEGYIFDTCNFSGTGTPTVGVLFSDNKARWTENRGVSNSASLTGYYMTGNATVTPISTVSTPVKAEGTTIPITISQRFETSTSNRSTYIGAIARDFKVTVISSLVSDNNNQIGLYIAKNGIVLTESMITVTTNAGGRSENSSTQAILELSDTDYIEVYVENNTGTNDITVASLNVITEALN